MADEAHLKVIRQGVDAWNRWRRDNPSTAPDLIGADLTGEFLLGAHLVGADLSEADLSGADLTGADLSGADLTGADLSDADLTGTYFSGADLTGADLVGAHLGGAFLRGAFLRGADLTGADLTWADLTWADLTWADLTGADLSVAICEQANFSNADLTLGRLLGAHFNGATLTECRLWETQRAGWFIKGVICESVYWDKEGKEISTYGPGDFERLYAEKVRVLVKYPNGISPLEIVTLPALIQHLEASRPGCKLRLESIQDAPGGAVVTIVVEDAEDTLPEQMGLLRATIQSEAEQKAQYLRQALESERESLLLKGEVLALERTVDKLLSRQTFYLQEGDVRMGNEYKVGQGIAGQNVHAHDMTFNQIGGNIEESMDLAELADDLAKLRQVMKSEATEPEHDIAVSEIAKAEQAAKAKDSPKVAQSLKGAGKWALDVATKIGTSLATEAIKESMGMK